MTKMVKNSGFFTLKNTCPRKRIYSVDLILLFFYSKAITHPRTPIGRILQLLFGEKTRAGSSFTAGHW